MSFHCGPDKPEGWFLVNSCQSKCQSKPQSFTLCGLAVAITHALGADNKANYFAIGGGLDDAKKA